MASAGLDVVRALVVEDDEDDYLITRNLLGAQDRTRFDVEWCATYELARTAIAERRHDVYLIDYRLGRETGLSLIRDAFRGEAFAPVIMLTGHADDHDIDLEAADLGVTDFLSKGQLDATLLERSIRYAISNNRLLRVKEEFFALVSHELRTPLTSIVGYLQLLLEDEQEQLPAEQRREFLRVMDRNSQRLLRLVGDLLFAAQVDVGEVALERAEFDLTDVVRASVQAARAGAEGEGVELNSEIAEVSPCNGDGSRIGQAIDNLISNSIKFTSSGGSVTARLAARNGSAVIEVADTGMGIQDAEQERLFERFYRATAATTNGIEGTGLGLAIVKAIVDGHGGEVTFESTEGLGTTFRIRLPLQRASAQGGRHAEAGSEPLTRSS